MLDGKYAHLKDLAPIHLADPGNVLIVCCQGGVVIRYERKSHEEALIASWSPEELPQMASKLSQNLIRCLSSGDDPSTIPVSGQEFKLSKVNPETQVQEELLSFKISFDTSIKQPEELPRPPRKPYCILSLQNYLELQLLGELLPSDGDIGTGQKFLTRTNLRLNAGWDCIEIFPFFDIEQWKPEYAPTWAENDLLAAVATHQFEESQFQSLDPKAEARRQYAELLRNFKALLDSSPKHEEILQSFLKDNPALLCPTHTKVWPKLALGSTVTDFVFQEATKDYLLVELERSNRRLFIKNGHLSSDLNHAKGQVTDWKRYIEDNLSTVQRELGLSEISSSPKALIVIGRSDSLTPRNRRTLATVENEVPKLKIMTYDDVYENAKAAIENLLGPIWETPGHTRIYYLPN